MSRYVDIFKLFLFTKVKMRLKMITTAPTPSGLTCPGCQGRNENDKLALQAFIFGEIITIVLNAWTNLDPSLMSVWTLSNNRLQSPADTMSPALAQPININIIFILIPGSV